MLVKRGYGEMVNARDLKSRTEKFDGSSPSTPIFSYAKLAAKSNHPKYKHAAIVFHNGDMVGWANNLGNHHAEVRALTIAKMYGYKKNLTILSVRIGKEGTLRLAKPCYKCYLYCKQHGVTTILYSTDKQNIVKMKQEE